MIEIYDMTEEEKVKCHSIIHTASLIAGAIGAGLAQLPTSDNLAIVPIQLTMIIELGAVFKINLDKSTAKGTLARYHSNFVERSISSQIEIFVGCFFILLCVMSILLSFSNYREKTYDRISSILGLSYHISISFH